jgi:hypothetical protein
MFPYAHEKKPPRAADAESLTEAPDRFHPDSGGMARGADRLRAVAPGQLPPLADRVRDDTAPTTAFEQTCS